MKNNKLMIVWMGCLALWLGWASQSYAGALLADLENALMCKCDDKCGKVLINCTCSTSDKTRAELRQRLESGLTVDQIVKIYVDKYGETILSAPTKTGFNLTAWLTPFAAIVGGGLGIRKLVGSWLKKNRDDTDSSGKAEQGDSPIADSGYESRLKKELDNLEV